MAKNDLEIRSSYLLTEEKSPIKSLFTGRLLNDLAPGNFVFYLIEIDTAHEDANRAKKVIVDTLEKNSRNNEVYNQNYLEGSLENINDSLEIIAKSGEKKWIGNLNAIIGVIEDDILHLASSGRISGYLIRKGRLSSLSESSNVSPIPQKTFIDITSGPLVASDKIFFGNNILFDYLSLDRIRRILENQSVSYALGEMTKNLKHKKVSLVNAVFLEVIDRSKAPSSSGLDSTEFYYLDEKEENIFQKTKKSLAPVTNGILKSSAKLIILIKESISDGAKTLSRNIGINWREKYKPKTKELLGKGAPIVSNAYKNIRSKINIGVNKHNKEGLDNIKIKTRLYTKDSISKFEVVFQTIHQYIKQFLGFVLKKENRKILYIVIIICLLGLGYVKVRSNNITQDKKSESQKLSEMLPQAEDAYAKAKENHALGKSDGTKELEDALTMAKKSSELTENKDKSDKLIRDIQKTLDDLNKTTRFYNPVVTISVGSKIQKSILVGSNIYSINVDGKIYSINTNNKERVLLASIGRDNGEVSDMTFSENDQKIYILTSKQKIIAYDVNTKTNELVSTDGSKDWEKAISVSAFSSSLYLLNNENGEITKHTKQEDGFSKSTIYADNKKMDLKNSINIQIDGNIYVLLNNGQITKFSKGALDSGFQLKTVPDPGSTIKSPTKLVTGEDIIHLYVLDRSLNRIIKFDKSGIFINQYALEGVNIDDFLVNTKIQRIWIISDSNIYELNM